MKNASTPVRQALPSFGFARFTWAFVMFALPVIAAIGANQGTLWLCALPMIAVYTVIPVLDYLINPTQPAEFERNQVTHKPFVRQAFDLPILCFPAWFATLFGTLWLTQSLSGWVWFVCVAGLGIAGGIVAINPAHELIHRGNRIHRAIGGLMIASVNYGAFKVEHIRGHHRWVCTDKDPASALRGESLYKFMLRSFIGNLLGGFRLEQDRLKKTGLGWYHNEVLQWYAVSSGIACALFFVAGAQAVGGFVIASLFAIMKLEMINYIEHYGLRRQTTASGDIEPISAAHSWNCNTWLINAILFNVQRHADHHANPGREYLALRSVPDAPQLPFGYASMVLTALVPPLWFALMDKRLDAYTTQMTVTAPAYP